MTKNALTGGALTRRTLVRRSGTAAAALFLAACTSDAPSATGVPATAAPVTATAVPAAATALPTATKVIALVPTPWCDDEDEPTLAEPEGPFYTPQTPERTSFLGDGPGTAMVVTGHVLTTDCQPIAGAWLDFWHADDSGEYDNAGYRFRGHFFTDENGAYRLETVVPGLYPGRTRHFHVKSQAPQSAVLTTQLYFPGEAQNARDGLFHDSLLMTMSAPDDQLTGTFDFVLA